MSGSEGTALYTLSLRLYQIARSGLDDSRSAQLVGALAEVRGLPSGLARYLTEFR
jgi:hypothetical protein